MYTESDKYVLLEQKQEIYVQENVHLWLNFRTVECVLYD